MLILVFGVAGEITAILTLSQEAASVWARYIVEFAVIFLTVAAAAGPALALIRASRSDSGADSPGEPSTAEPPANEEDRREGGMARHFRSRQPRAPSP
jgi:hypothetical protein